MTPYKGRPNCWEIDWRPEGRNGVRRRQVVEGVTKAQAMVLEQRMRRMHKPAAGGVNPLIRDAVPEWLEWMTLHRAEKTVTSIGYALANLLPAFGSYCVRDLSEARIVAYQQARRHAPVACNLELNYLQSLINWMARRHLGDRLPFKIERLPVKKKLPQIPTPEQLAHWLACVTPDGPFDAVRGVNLPGPKMAMIWIMLRCGLRFQEVTALRWEDLDLVNRVFHVTRAKGGRTRIAILPEQALAILLEVKRRLEESGAVATGLLLEGHHRDGTPTGQPITNMKTLFKTASARSGVPIKGPHTLRHICGTYTLEATGDLRLVQETLGHTQIRTTQLYTQISGSRLKAGQELTAAVFAPMDGLGAQVPRRTGRPRGKKRATSTVDVEKSEKESKSGRLDSKP